MNGLERDRMNLQLDWQIVGDAMRSAVQEVAGHLGHEALNEQIALVTTVPDSVVGFPMPLGSIVHMRNGLPLSSRTVEEMLADHETKIAYEASYKRSAERRSPPKHPSRTVVNFLDDISEIPTAIVKKIDPSLKLTNDYLQLLQADKLL